MKVLSWISLIAITLMNALGWFMWIEILGLAIAVAISAAMIILTRSMTDLKSSAQNKYLEVTQREVLYRSIYFILFLISFVFMFHAVYLHLNWSAEQAKCRKEIDKIQKLKSDFDEKVNSFYSSVEIRATTLAEQLDAGNATDPEVVKSELNALFNDNDTVQLINYDSPPVLDQVKQQMGFVKTNTIAKYRLSKEKEEGSGYYDKLIEDGKATFETPFNVVMSSFEYRTVRRTYAALRSDVEEHFPELVAKADAPEQEAVAFYSPWKTLSQAQFALKLFTLLIILGIVFGALANYVIMKRASTTSLFPPQHKKSNENLIFIAISVIGLIVILVI